MKRSMQGFNLIELMIAVAVLGILASMAYPSYVQYLVRTHRSEAQRTLVQIQQMMERHFVAFGTYADAALGTAGVHTVGPQRMTRADRLIYTFSFAGAPPDANSYRIRATPAADGANHQDGYLQIDSVDERHWDRNANGQIEADEKTWNP